MPETFIFDTSAEKEFYEKLEDFHETFVYHLVLNGVSKKGQDLESIKMTKNPNASLSYCKKLVGGLMNIKPKIVVRLTEDNETKLECIFTHIYDGNLLNSMFMIQNVINWPQIGRFSCQVWYLGSTSWSEIKTHWT